MQLLTQNFTLEEMVASSTAAKLRIANNPNQEQIDCLQALCENVLQPLRNSLGMIRVTSGYRCPELCVAIGSTSNSRHTLGQAADIKSPSYPCWQVAKWIINNVTWDGLIYETPNLQTCWIHVSYDKNKTKQREKIVHYNFDGKYINLPRDGIDERLEALGKEYEAK